MYNPKMRVYIHIPFCVKKCPYCAFGSVTDFKLKEDYFRALKIDLESQILEFSQKNILNSRISSVFFGGGTPSVVESEFYEQIFAVLKPHLSKNAEITLEANPNPATLAWLKDLRGFGANRISFGAQSFNAKKLEFLGRIHSSEDVFTAVKNAKKAGFKNINVDLIYGTKLDNKKLLNDEIANIAKLKALGVTHISAYSLSLESGTPFFAHKEYQKDSAVLANFVIKGLKNLGFMPYEISNFCLDNKKCKHNLGYWRGDDYLGVGAFSVGCVNSTRLNAPKNLKSYIKEPTKRQKEHLSSDDWAFERVFLGLRSSLGVEAKYIKNKELLALLIKEKKLILANSRIYNENFLLADELATALF